MNTPAAKAGSFPHGLTAVVPCPEIPPGLPTGLVQKFREASATGLRRTPAEAVWRAEFLLILQRTAIRMLERIQAYRQPHAVWGYVHDLNV